MNNRERVKELVNKYVQEHGNQAEMTRDEFLEWVNEKYENISANKNNLYPTDMSFNLYNAGLKDFPGTCLCLVYVEERKTYRLVGSDYKYTGPVYQYKGKMKEKIIGYWNNGIFQMEEKILSEKDIIQRENLESGIKRALKLVPVTVSSEEKNVSVCFQERLISGVIIGDGCYKIYNASSEWADTTTYLCNEEDDGTWSYYLDTIDECVGEMKRLIIFEIKKEKKSGTNKKGKSELRQILSRDLFENAYLQFIEQAEKNAISKRAHGSKIPFGFLGKNEFDGAGFSQHFGQGAASNTPYMNWWVVSIYYLVDSDNIIVGIERDRYPYLKKMKPLKFKQIGNKKSDIAVFYESTKERVNYDELYETFINVAEEVMQHGLK